MPIDRFKYEADTFIQSDLDIRILIFYFFRRQCVAPIALMDKPPLVVSYVFWVHPAVVDTLLLWILQRITLNGLAIVFAFWSAVVIHRNIGQDDASLRSQSEFTTLKPFFSLQVLCGVKSSYWRSQPTAEQSLSSEGSGLLTARPFRCILPLNKGQFVSDITKQSVTKIWNDHRKWKHFATVQTNPIKRGV